MKLTRVIAIGVILGSAALSALNAQTLRNASPPAEFPPASFNGKQYVDSRGCIYIRAGIDGNVTWVPRVSRSRKQVCGYKPTAVAGSTPALAPKPVRPPVIITATPPPATATTTASPATRAPSPARVATTAAPRPPKVATVAPRAVPVTVAPTVRAAPAQRKPSPGPAPTVFPGAKPKATPAPAQVATTAQPQPRQTTRRQPSPGPAATVYSNPPAAPAATASAPRIATTPATAPARRTPSPAPAATVYANPQAAAAPSPAATAPPTTAAGCNNASAFSQQYINKPGGRFKVRCGPQSEAPVTYGTSQDQSSSLSLPPDTRVVPRHVFENRQNTTDVIIPAGFKAAWDDDRLNTKRAERTLQPAKVEGIISVPAGFRIVDWDDNRLNLRRGITTPQGDAQTNMIWSNTVPRKLIPAPTQRQVVKVPRGTAAIQDPQTLVVMRFSTRSGQVVVLQPDR